MKFFSKSPLCHECLLGVKPCEWLLLQVVLGKNWGTLLNFRLEAGGLLNECSTDPCVR